ncbi:MAG: helix-turn-helix transcriptional regulator [Phenylobacterium sp.]|uniref:helix-turn-helix domain-containing protein n=1 Tax=Phenylobacterium sp. TaxID=1871053 RepID=UPI002735EB21|nr:helix-turn-helix transcriptional regulator [Phenylobacterium sp.]MDP3749706.1 helix-turn-helix transcriptional regulator [Phenylobacterium sp.]
MSRYSGFVRNSCRRHCRRHSQIKRSCCCRRFRSWRLDVVSERSRRRGGRAIDADLARRLRAKRREARLSMEALAAALGVSYQQVQKYETGANRISASTLYEIAAALRVPISDFYEDLPGASACCPRSTDRVRFETLMATPGGPEMLEAFLALPRRLRRPLIELTRGVTDREPLDNTAKVVALPTWR